MIPTSRCFPTPPRPPLAPRLRPLMSTPMRNLQLPRRRWWGCLAFFLWSIQIARTARKQRAVGHVRVDLEFGSAAAFWSDRAGSRGSILEYVEYLIGRYSLVGGGCVVMVDGWSESDFNYPPVIRLNGLPRRGLNLYSTRHASSGIIVSAIVKSTSIHSHSRRI